MSSDGLRLSPLRRYRADPAAYFSPEEVAKARAYQRPLRWVGLASGLTSFGVLVAVVLTKAAPRAADAAGLEAWPLRLVAVAAGTVGLTTLCGLPFGAWRSLVWDRRWGFSTESLRSWAVDQLKGLVVGVVLLSLLALPIWALIRATRWWWLGAWGVFVAFQVILLWLGPVVLAPIFNRFTPLADQTLAERLVALARRAGLRVSQVLVMDASRRTRKDNAFFAGLGGTKRIVLFDNLLQYPPEEVEAVVAHEAGHWRHHHTLALGVLVAAISLAVFAALRVVTASRAVLERAGVRGVEDPAALPLVLAAMGAGFVAFGLAVKWASRIFERQADLFALDLTRDPARVSGALRRLATRNLAELAPTFWQRANATHPPVAERLAMADAWRAARR